MELLEASLEIGLPILGLPEALGGVSEERSAMAGTLVAEALGQGRHGAGRRRARARLGRDRHRPVGDRRAAADLPAGVHRRASVPAAALALAEPQVLFDALSPRTTATRTGDGFVLDGVKSLVPRGADAELFVVGASSTASRCCS